VSPRDPLAPPLSYRDLRNTPGIVAERLVDGRPVPISIEGVTQALLVPIPSGADAAEFARELARVRFGMLLRESHQRSIELGLDRFSMDDIDGLVAEARAERMRAELPASGSLGDSYGDTPPRRPGSARQRAKRKS
jgi:hypothetical protein